VGEFVAQAWLPKPQWPKPWLPKPKSLLRVLCLPTALVLPIGRTETSAGLDFTGSFSDKRRLPCKAYGYANFEHNGVALNVTLYLAQCGPFFFPATKGT
jgi:hypothetical protein